jgi:hypothetical protein
MAEPFGTDPPQPKAAVVADSVNRLIQNLVLRSAKGGGIRDIFHIGLIGYGPDVAIGLGGNLDACPLIPISRLGNTPVRLDTRTRMLPDGDGGMVERTVKVPVWYEPKASGPAPLCAAIETALKVIRAFTDTYPGAFPPIVLNMTGGPPTDGNPAEPAVLMRSISTTDGNVLHFNVLISGSTTAPTTFPASEDSLSEEYARELFRISSQLPPKLLEAARAEGLGVEDGARGVVINADPTALVRFLDIGTRVSVGSPG